VSRFSCLGADLWGDTLVPGAGGPCPWLAAPHCLEQHLTLSPSRSGFPPLGSEGAQGSPGEQAGLGCPELHLCMGRASFPRTDRGF